MSNQSSHGIAPCFWVLSEDRESRSQFAEGLANRLRSDGSNVEILENHEVNESLSLSEFDDSDQRCQAICYLLVNLQKNGVIPIFTGGRDLLAGAESSNEYLEKQTLVLDRSLDGGGHLQNSIELELNNRDSELETLITHGEDRGLFDEAVSDHRSEEEVTDRLKNLGYI